MRFGFPGKSLLRSFHLVRNKITLPRRRAEQALRESEQRFRTIFDSSPDSMVIVAWEDGRYLDVNEAYVRFLGYPREEIVGRTALELGVWVDKRERKTIRDILVQQGRVQDFEARLRTKTGEVRNALVSVDLQKLAGQLCMVSVTRDITERKRMEDALRESEERFSRAFKANPGPTVISDIQTGRFIDVNEHWLKMLGHTREETIGHTSLELGIWADPDHRRRMVAELLEKGFFREAPTRFITKSGETKWALWSAERITLGGEPVMLSLLYDITKRKRTEEALEESMRIYRAIAANLPGGAVFVLDKELRYILAEGEAMHMAGYTPKDFEGKMVQEALEPDLAQEYQPFYKRALTGIPFTHEHASHGRYYITQGVPLRDPQGKVYSVLAVSYDVTERMAMEKQVRLQGDILLGINRILEEAITCETEEELGRTCLRVAEELTGSQIGFIGEIGPDGLFHDLVISDTGWDLCAMYDQHGHRRAPGDFPLSGLFGKVLKEGRGLFTNEPESHPDSCGTPQGHPSLTAFLGVPLVQLDKSVGMIGVANREGGYRKREQYILEALAPAMVQALSRKRAELALKQERLALEERVKDRTRELERANKVKDEFLANMSHEIRTPLAGVFGMTEVLLNQELPPPVREDLDLIRSSADNVLTLLNDLLDLSRVEQGKLVLCTRAFRIRELLEDIVRSYRIPASQKDIELKLRISEKVPELILCDPDRLCQIIKNLLSNAIKFTEEGIIRLGVQSEEQEEQCKRLWVSVSDTGIGIPQENLDDIFESFAQLDPSYSKKFPGAGLGLAISKQLVDLMGGSIAVTSELNKGTTFSFSVLYEEAGPKDIADKPVVLRLEDLPSLSILVAEDNPVNRLFLKRALARAGHAVVEAENGLQALEKLDSERFDLVLMDIQMPEMDGVEATRQIRTCQFENRNIPVIALTAYAMKGDREKFTAQGMDGYVTKPVDFGELTRVISEVIKEERVE